jgi:hypothetical protein
MSKTRELAEEFRKVFAGRGNLIDSILPPLIFFIVNAVWGLDYALWGAIGVALLFTVFRLIKRQPLRYALGGIGGVLLAVALVKLLGRAEGFFLPGILTTAVTVLLILISLIARRPLVAWTSFIARRWPLEWYWHPQVRPAYAEVTWAWLLFFALKLLLQWLLFRGESAELLGLIQFIMGWPATIVLLVVSYLYGLWRLRNLQGPSVEEFKEGSQPPWEGQRQGF